MNLNVGWSIEELRPKSYESRESITFFANKDGFDCKAMAEACHVSGECILDASGVCPFNKWCNEVTEEDWASIITRENVPATFQGGMKDAFGRVLGKDFLDMFWTEK